MKLLLNLDNCKAPFTPALRSGVNCSRYSVPVPIRSLIISLKKLQLAFIKAIFLQQTFTKPFSSVPICKTMNSIKEFPQELLCLATIEGLADYSDLWTAWCKCSLIIGPKFIQASVMPLGCLSSGIEHVNR